MNLSTKFAPKRLGTHSGQFHCDEAFGSYMLRLLFPDLEIVRTRDERVLADCDIVIDVGAVYDHGRRRYDHHQKSFAHSMSTLRPPSKWTTKLSSAGLVYAHYGREVLAKVIGADVPADELDSVYANVYESFVHEIDAIDNGVPACDGPARYAVRTCLSSRVGRLNRPWNYAGAGWDDAAAFERAVALVGAEFVETVLRAHRAWLPARRLVVDALERRFDAHRSGRVLQLSAPCPWKEHYFLLEQELAGDLDPRIDYVVFEDRRAADDGGGGGGGSSSWRIQSVPVSPESFVLRRPLPAAWRGLRDDELSAASGVPGCVFCHASGFIGGNSTHAGVIQMAEKALES